MAVPAGPFPEAQLQQDVIFVFYPENYLSDMIGGFRRYRIDFIFWL